MTPIGVNGVNLRHKFEENGAGKEILYRTRIRQTGIKKNKGFDMNKRQMYGVVLWSDDSEKKAVIWCEDHGNLAYYSQNDSAVVSDFTLDAGDFIQFDVSEVQQVRLARNLRLIGQDQYPTIAERLSMATPAHVADQACRQSASNSTVVEMRGLRRA
jgi:hypothetical protein